MEWLLFTRKMSNEIHETSIQIPWKPKYIIQPHIENRTSSYHTCVCVDVILFRVCYIFDFKTSSCLYLLVRLLDFTRTEKYTEEKTIFVVRALLSLSIVVALHVCVSECVRLYIHIVWKLTQKNTKLVLKCRKKSQLPTYKNI